MKQLKLFFILLLFTACSSVKESTEEIGKGNKEEIYVFDDSGSDAQIESDSFTSEAIIDTSENFIRDEVDSNVTIENQHESAFTVQLGAFTTKSKADSFVKENQNEINYKMEVQYSKTVNLFVVWLPKFTTKEEAENVRNILWQIEKFKDAFIVIVD